MLDRSTFWSPALGTGASLEGSGITVSVLPAMPQIMVSGDLEAALRAHGLSQTLGLLGEAEGSSYALRLARNRALIVGAGQDLSTSGWKDGVASSPMTGALAVFEIAGENAQELLCRASSIDFRKPSACAALSFAGVTSVLYRHEGRLRLHLDRGLSTYMLDWISKTGLF